MNLTVGGSARNVMGEIRGGNGSRTEMHRGHGGEMKCREEVYSPMCLLFTPSGKQPPKGALDVCKDGIINVLCLFWSSWRAG